MKELLKKYQHPLQCVFWTIMLVLGLSGVGWAKNIYVGGVCVAVVMTMFALVSIFLIFSAVNNDITVLDVKTRNNFQKMHDATSQGWYIAYQVITLIILIGAGWWFTGIVYGISLMMLAFVYGRLQYCIKKYDEHILSKEKRYKNLDGSDISDGTLATEKIKPEMNMSLEEMYDIDKKFQEMKKVMGLLERVGADIPEDLMTELKRIDKMIDDEETKRREV